MCERERRLRAKQKKKVKGLGKPDKFRKQEPQNK